MHVYKMSEWQSPTGRWYCNDTSDLAGIAGLWWVPARMLNLSLVDFVKLLITEYKPDKINFNGKTLIYSWDSKNYNLCHSWLLFINKKAREKNYII